MNIFLSIAGILLIGVLCLWVGISIGYYVFEKIHEDFTDNVLDLICDNIKYCYEELDNLETMMCNIENTLNVKEDK